MERRSSYPYVETCNGWGACSCLEHSGFCCHEEEGDHHQITSRPVSRRRSVKGLYTGRVVTLSSFVNAWASGPVTADRRVIRTLTSVFTGPSPFQVGAFLVAPKRCQARPISGASSSVPPGPFLRAP
jgi:hypothetical protein